MHVHNKLAEAELSQAAKFQQLPKDERDQRLSRLSQRERYELNYNWAFWRRPKQVIPDDKRIVLLRPGRGWGKTRVISEWIRERWQSGFMDRCALIADTPKDAIQINIQGPSGILRCHPFYERPKFTPSHTKLTWPERGNRPYNAEMIYFSAEDPESLRGFSCDTCVIDELAKSKKQDDVFKQVEMILRESDETRLLIATTPKPTPLMVDLITKRKDVHVIGGSSYENTNLSKSFFDNLENVYEGTRYGKQEIHGDLLLDHENALWKQSYFQPITDDHINLDDLERVVVGVDPSGAADKEQDQDKPNQIGIIVAGKIRNEEGAIVLADYSGVMGPEQWGERVAQAYHKWGCDKIVVERNFGGEMCRFTIQAKHPNLPVELVTSSRGKHIRAEPISMLYAQHKVFHRVQLDDYNIDHLQQLEEQMLNTTPVEYEGRGSPDKMDAAVFALTDLLIREHGQFFAY